MEKSCKFYIAFSIIFIVVVSLIVGCFPIRLINEICSPFGQDRKWYLLVIMAIYIFYLIFMFLSIRVLLKSAKYFSRINVFVNLVESDSDKDKELIKKYCDTPVDL